MKPNFEQEKHLHNLCSIATKLYNTDNWQRREAWDKTGKIPNVYTQKKALKDNHWFKLLQVKQHKKSYLTYKRIIILGSN